MRVRHLTARLLRGQFRGIPIWKVSLAVGPTLVALVFVGALTLRGVPSSQAPGAVANSKPSQAPAASASPAPAASASKAPASVPKLVPPANSGGASGATASTQPPTTNSYYMSTADPQRLAALGASAGKATVGSPTPRNDLIIVMFGAPMQQGGVEGAQLYQASGNYSGGSNFASTAQMEAGAEAFITSYLNNADPQAHLQLVIGTSNWGNQVTKEHGAAWGTMVKDISNWTSANGKADRVAAFGGSDIEMGWGAPGPARAWVDGYHSATSQLLYNFGDAEGMPTTDNGKANAPNGWTQDDVWYVAWGAGNTAPVPQIYNSTFAKEWYQMVRYSLTKVQNGFKPMQIAGVLTMWGDASQTGQLVPGFDFTPQQGWQQLTNLLKGNPQTSLLPQFASDIRKEWLP